jgi:hypothetical protein
MSAELQCELEVNTQTSSAAVDAEILEAANALLGSPSAKKTHSVSVSFPLAKIKEEGEEGGGSHKSNGLDSKPNSGNDDVNIKRLPLVGLSVAFDMQKAGEGSQVEGVGGLAIEEGVVTQQPSPGSHSHNSDDHSVEQGSTSSEGKSSVESPR